MGQVRDYKGKSCKELIKGLVARGKKARSLHHLFSNWWGNWTFNSWLIQGTSKWTREVRTMCHQVRTIIHSE